MLRNSVKTFCLQKASKSSLKAGAVSVIGVGGDRWLWPSPGFWNLTFFYHVFNKKYRFLNFDMEKWNFVTFAPSKNVWGDLWKFPLMVPSGKNSFRRPCCQHRRPYIFCHFEKTFIPCKKKISTQLHLATFLVGDNFINKIWQRIPLLPYKTLARAATSCIFGGWQNNCNFLFQRNFWRFWNVKEREIVRFYRFGPDLGSM